VISRAGTEHPYDAVVSGTPPDPDFFLRAARSIRRRTRPAVDRATQQARRSAFVARTQAAAFWAGAELDLQVAPDVEIARDVRVTFGRNTTNRLVLGPSVAIEEGVRIRFNGGKLEMADRVRLRPDVVMNIGGGHVEMLADCVLSWNAVVHCSEHVFLDEMVGVAEQVTIADTNHYFTTPDEYFWHNARSKPVSIGRNTWICPKVSIAPGAKVGAHCIVTSNSVVVGEIPDGSLATGVPAQARPMHLPWHDEEKD
jgi:acetyltransferase-like isoleucine patch superfamily enzyme